MQIEYGLVLLIVFGFSGLFLGVSMNCIISYYNKHEPYQGEVRTNMTDAISKAGVCTIIIVIILSILYVYYGNYMDKNPNYSLDKWIGETKVIEIESIKKNKESNYEIIDINNNKYYADKVQDRNIKKAKIGTANLKNSHGIFFKLVNEVYYAEKIE